MKIQNTSGALNPDCLAARPASKAWECMFAQNSYAVTKVPTFVENSALDMWQMWCIYGAAPISGFPSPNSSINGNCSAPMPSTFATSTRRCNGAAGCKECPSATLALPVAPTAPRLVPLPMSAFPHAPASAGAVTFSDATGSPAALLNQ